jgi:palmitoyl-protein thioesterase
MRNWCSVALILAAAAASTSFAATMRPVVLMHGLFANFEAMSHVQGWLEQDFPGIYVHNADIPVQNNSNGKVDSLLIPMDQQLAIFAAQLQADPKLQDGFDMVCHSQGGLLCRSFIEVHNKPVVHNFISLAGPQAGIYGMPDVNDLCPDVECPWLIEFMDNIAENWATTEPLLQKYVSFAQYWRNPVNYSLYLNTSGFLAGINNERADKNETYRANMLSTTGNMTFVMALLDHIVVPKESAHWGFFALGQETVVESMQDGPLYQTDSFGLRTLTESGRLELVSVNCTHQHLPQEECKSIVYDAVIKPRVGTYLTS